ncbi:MAG: hypothetical protein R3C25_01955 [Hyphomonadaceae bacterium]
MKMLLLAALAALGACATTLPQIVQREGGAFDVRYDASVQSAEEADAKANGHCPSAQAEFISQETGFDGFAYRSYRCAERAQ